MQIPIEDIIIKKRIRKDLGDMTPLVESLRHYGLIHPILINKKNILIAGRRRLEAARILHWRSINALVIDAKDAATKLEYEVEENLQRREFTPEESIKALARIQRLRNPSFFRRLCNAIVNFFTHLFGRD